MVDRLTYAFGVAFSVTALLSAFLLVLKELEPGVHQWMTEVTGNHWATHGAFDILMFVILGLIMLAKVPGPLRTLTLFVAGSTILSSAIIAGFFLFK